MLTKTQKIKFVEDCRELLKSYKVIGVVQLNGIPDRLLQSTKNQLRANTRFIISRKKLLAKILESDEKYKRLAEHLASTSAIILSNDDPFELYKKFKSNSLRLAAKPGQTAPEDVSVNAGETGIQPGQTVTELKSAGIDVQIQKGKVVIAKDKIVVKRGEPIGAGIAKALHILEIFPFRAVIEPSALISDGMLFSRRVLGIDSESTAKEIAICFTNALQLSLEAKIINAYTINNYISRAYGNALHLGLECKILDSGIIDLLIMDAASKAASLGVSLNSSAA